jgi:hypothetical protein
MPRQGGEASTSDVSHASIEFEEDDSSSESVSSASSSSSSESDSSSSESDSSSSASSSSSESDSGSSDSSSSTSSSSAVSSNVDSGKERRSARTKKGAPPSRYGEWYAHLAVVPAGLKLKSNEGSAFML